MSVPLTPPPPPPPRPTPPQPARRRSPGFLVALLAAIVGWIVAAVFAVMTLGYSNAERSAEADNAYQVDWMCTRLEDDPTLLDDWRAAIELDDAVTGELVNLTASESRVRPLSRVLAPLAGRLLTLAGSEPFEVEDGWWGHRDILGAAMYASRAAAAIDAWDFADTRYRILQGQMSASLEFSGSHTTGLGYASDLDILAARCS